MPFTVFYNWYLPKYNSVSAGSVPQCKLYNVPIEAVRIPIEAVRVAIEAVRVPIETGGHVSGFFYLRVIRKWP